MGAMDDRDVEETRAHAALPQMDIDIVHRRARDGDRELIAISIELFPFSQGLERLAEMNDPFRLWGQMAALAWWPWLQGLRALTAQPDRVRRLPPGSEE